MPIPHSLEDFDNSEEITLIGFVEEWIQVGFTGDENQYAEDILNGIRNKFDEFKSIDELLENVIYDNIQVSPIIDKGHSSIVDYLEKISKDRVEDLKNCKEVQELLQELK